MIFETHAHYDDERFDEDREELIGGLYANGIEYAINCGASIDGCKKTLEYVGLYDHMLGALGIHPEEAHTMDEAFFDWIKENAANNKKIVAIGEIGLDYYWTEPPRDIQQFWFRRQIELARQLKLPMIIHSREAAKDTLDIMKEHKANEIGGVLHCFSYSVELAKEFLDMGFYIGIGGVVTFKNAKKLKEVVQMLPLERILLETDAPYMAPEPHRGKRNSSLFIPHIAKTIADIKGIEYEEVVEVTNKNAKQLFRQS